jgi:hypothetical protein
MRGAVINSSENPDNGKTTSPCSQIGDVIEFALLDALDVLRNSKTTLYVEPKNQFSDFSGAINSVDLLFRNRSIRSSDRFQSPIDSKDCENLPDISVHPMN